MAEAIVRLPSAEDFEEISDLLYDASLSMEALYWADHAREGYAKRCFDTARELNDALSKSSAFIRKIQKGLGY